MLLSYNWLKKFINIPKSITPAKLAELLTLSTVEVESVTNQSELLDKVVVGKVTKLENHPNADKLKVAYVDIGNSKSPKSPPDFASERTRWRAGEIRNKI